ncbi:LysE family translocator [Pseudonocardia eucalypti]|uniref:LysE family translocator n=1 Tax=Pseudonocardia eucalypti TaxID=648755 RepID=A0ABP9Q3C7_9PSEU|nr:threonine/homoserine/homoserine lactone efflux protein [Pseudonocardia eucalypti]
MPSASTLLLYVLAASALVAIPGPNHIYIVTRSLSQGRAAGLVSALGVESATLVYMVAASVGLAAVIASSALAFDTVRFVGAAYLIYLGLRVLLRQQPVELTELARLSLRRVYLEAAAVNLLNPKVALFFVAFLPQFIDPARGPVAAQIVVLGLIITAIGLTSDVVYALAAGQLGGWLGRRPGFARGQRIATGTTYLALGVAAAFSGRPATQGTL